MHLMLPLTKGHLSNRDISTSASRKGAHITGGILSRHTIRFKGYLHTVNPHDYIQWSLKYLLLDLGPCLVIYKTVWNCDTPELVIYSTIILNDMYMYACIMPCFNAPIGRLNQVTTVHIHFIGNVSARWNIHALFRGGGRPHSVDTLIKAHVTKQETTLIALATIICTHLLPACTIVNNYSILSNSLFSKNCSTQHLVSAFAIYMYMIYMI